MKDILAFLLFAPMVIILWTAVICFFCAMISEVRKGGDE